jgi:acyl-CoA synthetase (AMP-forming)/AMP-acid ligase II
MYTSGSTGHPKGVLSSHRNIVNALYTWYFVKEVTEILKPELVEENPEFPPAIIANVPLFHVTGSHAQFLACFLNQRKLVMMYKWDADQALDLIEAERISVLHGVPTQTWEVMQSDKFDSTDLRSLRGIQSGGAPRPPEHLSMMLDKFPDQAIPGLGYGLTETNAIGAIISGKFYESRPHSTGRPTPPVTTLLIHDEAGRELKTGEVGEICIKGPTIMKGYWNQPKATTEAIRDGWFYTGDIGKLDELGFVIILDRAKDIVIRGGENIGCAEVEYAITEHPAVSEVSVYGIPDERLGEVLCASIMLKADSELAAPELKQFLVEKIAGFKIPELLYFQYQQLPRIAAGKIAKKQLRQETIDNLASS